MEKKTYHNILNTELSAQLAKKREELRALRFSTAGTRPKDTSTLPKLRKEIARILTEFSWRTKQS